MGIHHPRDAWKDENTRDLILAGQQYPTCFLCGNDLRGIMVYWHGMPTDRVPENNVLHLHPHCAKELAAHLCKDAILAVRVEEGKDPAPWKKGGK